MFLKNSCLISLVFFLLFSGCTKKNAPNFFTFSGMGTVLTVTYSGKKNSSVEHEVRDQVALFEKNVSYYQPESFVSRYNRLKKDENLSVPHWFCELLASSLKLGKQTDNAFDITYKVKGKLWDKKEGNPPTEKALQKLSPLVGSDLIVADCARNIVRKKKDGVIIDLGGVAKGYAIDSVAEKLKKHGIANFILNFGGDMMVCGSKNGEKWKIGIKNPLESGKMLKILHLSRESCTAIATSGDYERFFMKNGKKYSHILDPQTGHPVKYAKSITVVGKSATVTDLLATAISVKAEKEHFIKKIVASFGVAVYTLSGSPIQWQSFKPEARVNRD